MKALLTPLLFSGLIFASYSAAQRAPSPDRQALTQAKATKYIGMRHGSSLPDNLKSVAASLVSGMGDSKEYAIYEIHEGRMKMLWFERLLGRDDAGIPNWVVKDVIVLPTVRKNQVVVYGVCFRGKKPDGEIVAIADYQRDVEFFTRVRRAWRANRKTEKFEVISPKGIKCTNEGFGV